MLIKSKLVLFCSIFTLAVTAAMFPSDDIKANGASACPAFTSAMVDAAAMAFKLYPGVHVIAEDDPTIPSIFCQIDSQGVNGFRVEVNDPELYYAFVMGWGRRESSSNDFDTQLYSEAEQLSWGQMRACRAAILKSFVWKNYCAPELP